LGKKQIKNISKLLVERKRGVNLYATIKGMKTKVTRFSNSFMRNTFQSVFAAVMAFIVIAFNT